MANTTKIIATAQRLIKADGRLISLIEFNETPGNASRPWLGPSNPVTTPKETLQVYAVFGSPGGILALGRSDEVNDLIKSSEQIAIVSPGKDVDMTKYHQVLDGTVYWKISGRQIFKPGTALLIAYLGLTR